jgi:hypothetical protein
MEHWHYTFPFPWFLIYAHVTSSSYAVVEYTPQAYLQPDSDPFFSTLASKIANGTGPIISLVDGADVQTEFQDFGVNGESDLDLVTWNILLHLVS